jgi:cytidyltransferase-like protein
MVADIFHHGHVAFLKAARAMGDRLVVYVLDDEFVTRIKRIPIMTQSERLAVVEACRYVDEVASTGPELITRKFMRKHGYSSYAIGYSNDWEAVAKRRNCRDLPEDMIEVIPYTAGISSTIIRDRIKTREH